MYLYFICVGLWALYFYNHEELQGKSFLWFIFIFAGVYVFFSILFTFFYSKLPSFFLPVTGYQLVYSQFTSHNHLGDFLMLPLIGSLFFILQRKYTKIFLLISIGLFFFLLLSYSRSAYLALLVTFGVFSVMYMRKKLHISYSLKIIIGVVITMTVVFFFATVQQSDSIPFLSKVNIVLTNQLSLREKDLFANRQEYFNQSIRAFSNGDLSFWGIGSNNFVYISQKNKSLPKNGTESAHNIFLDIFIENGLVAGIVFFILVCFVWVRSKKQSVIFFLFLALLINFQTDYTYRIYCLFLLFFMLAVAIVEDKRKQLPVNIPFFVSFITILMGTFLILGQVFYTKEKYELAFFFNPLNKSLYEVFIEEKNLQGNIASEKTLVAFYKRLFSADPQVLYNIGRYYEKTGDRKYAIRYYQRSFEGDKYRNSNLMYRIYILMLLEYGQNEADNFYSTVVKNSFSYSVKEALSYKYKRNMFFLCLHTAERDNCAKEWGDYLSKKK